MDNFRQSDSMEPLMQMMEMMQKFSNIKQQQTMEEAENVQQNYDSIEDLHTPGMRSIKAVIPYMEPSYRRPLTLLIKCMELQRFMENVAEDGVRGEEITGDSWKRGMLIAIRPHIAQEKQQMIDRLVQILDMKDMMTMMQTMQAMQRGDSEDGDQI